MNRVNLHRGRKPIMVVAPHGYHEDDYNTEIIADVIATELQAYSVINIGWHRGENAILGESVANLNDINHCMLSPCRKEFLNPMLEFKDECIEKFNKINVFYIHGMANKIRKDAGDKVDIVLGFGQGDPPSYTCHLDYKNAMVTRFREEGLNVYQAKVGGKFAAWKPENLTQLWRGKYKDKRVHGMQIEIVNSLRSDPAAAVKVALRMTRALDKFLHSKTYFHKDMKVNEC